MGVDTDVNSMALTVVERSEAKDIQKWSQFVGGSKQVLEMKVGAGSAEQAGLSLTTIQANEEKVEANTIT